MKLYAHPSLYTHCDFNMLFVRAQAGTGHTPSSPDLNDCTNFACNTNGEGWDTLDFQAQWEDADNNAADTNGYTVVVKLEGYNNNGDEDSAILTITRNSHPECVFSYHQGSKKFIITCADLPIQSDYSIHCPEEDPPDQYIRTSLVSITDPENNTLTVQDSECELSLR